MGIGGTILSKVGIPIAVIAALGLTLYTFRSQITSAVKGGANVAGQAVGLPFAGFLEGLKGSLSQIPKTITIPFPEFKFAFGESGSELIGGGITHTTGDAVIKAPTGAAESNVIIKQDESGIITKTRQIYGDPNQRFQIGADFIKRVDIVSKFPTAEGLYDLPQTRQVEFLPLSREAIDYYKNLGINVKLSGQLYQGTVI